MDKLGTIPKELSGYSSNNHSIKHSIKANAISSNIKKHKDEA